jgi:N-acetylglucosamine-6-sulfatase
MAPHTLSASTVAKIDEIYRERLKTLLSVDDLVEKVVLELRRLGLLQKTHLIFTSDHGFHMGKPRAPLHQNASH